MDDDPELDLPGALHEVSNALTVVLGWLDAADQRAFDPSVREALSVARTHARLGYAVARRAIGADVSIDASEEFADVVARDAIRAVEQVAEERSVRVQLVENDGRAATLNEPSTCRQILINLLLNAIAFSPKGGVVRLEVTAGEDGAKLTVTDSGPGIPAEQADTLWEAPSSTRSGGAGIGLRHSRNLAQKKGGTLEHVRGGVGARFDLQWPAIDVRSDRRPGPRVGDLTGKRFLVLEDDPAVVSLIELALETRGATVKSARDADNMRRLVAGSEPFDAALIDLSPIATDTKGALDALRANNPDMPVILISGTAVGLPDVGDHQISDWVRKPFEMKEIVAALRGVAPTGTAG